LLIFYRRQRVDPVVALYRRFCHSFNKMGVTHLASETPEQFAKKVTSVRPELTEEVGEITELYYRLRYRPASAQELRLLRDRFKSKVKALRLAL
ncbi:MAG: DUF4129 domain-containing protein, partial [Gammaproteobacteria bacterium]|nr:DUF4129 domain-containing protein [Gammaproteobacteria bacterium]